MKWPEACVQMVGWIAAAIMVHSCFAASAKCAERPGKGPREDRPAPHGSILSDAFDQCDLGCRRKYGRGVSNVYVDVRDGLVRCDCSSRKIGRD